MLSPTRVPCGPLRRILSVIVLAAGVAGCGAASPGSSQTAATTADTTRPQVVKHHRRVRHRVVPALIAPAKPPARSVQVPVLTFHRVHSLPAVGILGLIVDPATFNAELTALQQHGYHTVSQARLFDALFRGRALPPKPVMISVDDGYVDDIETILPDLRRHHMVGTFNVITGRIHEAGFLTAGQIRELDRAEMDVCDHSAHHVELTQLTAAELRDEVVGSKRALERILGHPVYCFAYPFGAYDAAVIEAVRAAGYSMAYTTDGGSTESSASPLTIPRLHVGRDETPAGLVGLVGNA